MKVALLTNNVLPPREGIGRHVLELGKHLCRRGHQVTALVPGDSWRHWGAATIDGIAVRRFPTCRVPPFHHALAFRALREWLARTADGADLLHIHLPLLPPLRTGLRTVVTVHSPMLTDSAAIAEPGVKPLLLRAQASLLSRHLEQGWLDRADEIVAVSAGVAAELARAYALRGRQPRVISNAVDATYFAPAPWAERYRRVLYVGRLGVRKGLFRLVDAVARVPDPKLELVLVGEGPLRAALSRRVAELGLTSRVRFTGFLDRPGVRAQLRRAACFVNAADYETGPLTLLEALACATPVISTPTGLARELGAEPPLALVAAEPAAIAAAIVEILARPAAAAERAMAGRELVCRQFGWERAVDALEALYRGDLRAAA